ncbi:C4-dicarboxylate transport system permease small protein [Oceanicola granulosus HTCC2516]|uniref:TRAP transporter small permease protein n=1 Tax=Oceanicola granulosus (strain ATCC BAA-861 / DSM 15982 / KCTC 12143 / HTCC2516) TaxID=314256 RepID=Q2CJI3_OCEGH|nr:TRAP transporter small permease [Oceanicola granulosus]EAR53156.1 C4-dicarboxylate transport system permease small protein [Oceanicola granulosus HTCC2516]
MLNFWQVGGRYVFGSSLRWAEEVMRYGMVWVMMLGGTAAIYHGEHMAVDAVVDAVPRRFAHLLRSLLYGIGAVFIGLLVWYGWPAALANLRQSAAASGISMIYPYMALPVGGLLMILQIVLCFFAGFASTAYEEEPL